ncbi:hypothetical protein PAMP_001274 [Pampus punctatissimus]
MSDHDNNIVCSSSQTEMEEVMKKIARQKRVQHRQCLILEEIKLKVENEKLERENLLINEKYVQISHELDDMQRETTVHVECAQSSNDYILQLYVSKVPVVKQLQEELDRLQENIQNDDNIEKSIQEAELYKTPLLEEISTEEGESSGLYTKPENPQFAEDSDSHSNPEFNFDFDFDVNFDLDFSYFDSQSDPDWGPVCDPESDPQSDPQSDPDWGPDCDPESDPHSDPNPDSDSDPDSDHQSDPDCGPDSDPESDPHSNPNLQSIPDFNLDPQSDPDSDPDSDSDSDPDFDLDPNSDPESPSEEQLRVPSKKMLWKRIKSFSKRKTERSRTEDKSFHQEEIELQNLGEAEDPDEARESPAEEQVNRSNTSGWTKVKRFFKKEE